MSKRIIFHVDANSAYLSWEAVHRLQHGDSLDLRTVPSVVGGNQETRHGIILAKSIPTKKYGIITGESVFAAKIKCPQLIVVPPNYYLYMQCSAVFGDILREYSPLIEQYSIDEYFLDYTGMEKVLGDPVTAAYRLKDQIKEQLGFTVNIGISSNKLLAKMGSELKKPDMVHTLFPEEMSTKMWPLPVEELFGVGRATAPKLRDRGIQTIGDLANAEPHRLELFLKSYGLMIWNFANGRDESLVKINRRPIIKGIGNSTTIPFDVDDTRTAHLVLLSLVESVATRLRQAEYLTQLVSVSIRTNELYHYSHQRKFFAPTDSTNAIHEIACELFDEIWKKEPIRHLGVRVSELCMNSFIQPSLFERDIEKQRAMDHAVDEIRNRFGLKSVFRASFLHSGLGSIAGGTVSDEEYPMMSSLL
ncbi:MAG: DNA polymerase IV [Dehalobacter sp. 4CP]|uniref:DNA polymerase Y family protein n=1 Tax=Dehalobacter sp. CP TaxID=2594474 RepID=UPI0013C6BA35|nr:DNA polymerase IV [Dehalobacter sp. 4CP]